MANFNNRHIFNLTGGIIKQKEGTKQWETSHHYQIQTIRQIIEYFTLPTVCQG